MQTFFPSIHFSRSDGTKDVPCDNSYFRVKPCSGYATLNANNELQEGYAICTPGAVEPLYFCSWECIASNAKERVQ